MRILGLVASAALAIALSACATTSALGGGGTLQSQTSAVIGVPEQRLVLSDQREVGISLLGFTATDTQTNRQWSCTRSGGILYMGLSNPPNCTPMQ